jgi:hypothetical protein
MRLLALAFVTVVLGQPGPYSGDWTADFNGTTYVRLALNDKAGAPQGALSIGQSIHVDAQGNVDRVTEAAPTLRPMLDVHQNGDVLSFSYENGGDEIVRVATHRHKHRNSHGAHPREARQDGSGRDTAAETIPSREIADDHPELRPGADW